MERIAKMLSPEAQEVIHKYLRLPIEGKKVTVPYFNNKNVKVKRALRVLIGKGTPEEIAEEAIVMGLKEKVDLKELPDRLLKKFLVDHNLGIDCSAFVFHVLDAELQARKIGKLSKLLKIPEIRTPIRKMIAKLRTVENTNVKVLGDPENCVEVSMHNAKPGDMIVIFGSGGSESRDHVMVINQIDYVDGVVRTIHYMHSLKWSKDGEYNHGIKRGMIEITNPNGELLEQNWLESGATEDANETLRKAKNAKEVHIRRLKVFMGEKKY